MKNQHLRKGALPKNDVVPKQPLPSNALSTADVHSDRSATEKHMDNLNDDLLLTILNSLAPSQRQLIASTNKRLNLLCHSTYSSTPDTDTAPGRDHRPTYHDQDDDHLTTDQRRRRDHLPQTTYSDDDQPTPTSTSEDDHLTPTTTDHRPETTDHRPAYDDHSTTDHRPATRHLPATTTTTNRNSLRHVVSIRLCGLSTPPASPQLPILGSPALRTLALHCPELRHLALPLVTRGAAPALALLTQLHSLSLTVTDGGALEAVIKLIQLHSLSLTTQKDLFYLILQQSQVGQPVFFPHLSSLHLQNGLRVLQLPFFSGSMGDLGGHAQGLTELRIKQGLREPDLLNLSSLSRLRTLVCDSIILSEAPHEDPCIGTGISLPSVRTLRMTGNVCHYGVWADLFPNLEVLEATSAVIPSPHAVPITPFSSLTRLCGPATTHYPTNSSPHPQATSAVIPSPHAVPITPFSSLTRLPPQPSTSSPSPSPSPPSSPSHAYAGQPPSTNPPTTNSSPHPQATSAVNPSPHAVPITPFSSLTRLHWPATKLTPSLVSAASSLRHLSLANINSIPRIQEVLHMAAVPLGLRTLVLGFKGCLARFRPRQLQNVMTRSPASMDQATPTAERYDPLPASMDQATPPAERYDPLPCVHGSGVDLCDLCDLCFRPRQLQNFMTRSPASMDQATPTAEQYHLLTSVDGSGPTFPLDERRKTWGGIWTGDQVEWLTLKDEAPATTKEYGDCGRIVNDSVILAVIVRELRLIGCSAITVEGLEAGVRQAPHRLERIIVAGCPRITRHSVEHIPGSVNKHWLHVEWQTGHLDPRLRPRPKTQSGLGSSRDRRPCLGSSRDPRPCLGSGSP
eukprot:gene6758-2635_t